MDRNGYHMTYNKNRYQDYNTNVCGEYCVYFLHHRHRRGPTVLNHLFPKGWKSKQTDKYMREWFNEHYRKPKTHKGQCCKTFQQNCILHVERQNVQNDVMKFVREKITSGKEHQVLNRLKPV